MTTKSRIRFPRDQQREFIETTIARCGSIKILAAFLQLSPRTIRDWRREKFLISYDAVQKINAKYGISLPANLVLEDEFWYVKKGAQKGGLASIAKQGGIIGDPEIRKQRWREWWEEKGKFLPPSILSRPLPIRRPDKSIELAEFVGIVLGDGGISNYQLVITLHHTEEIEYTIFIMQLIKSLFGVDPQRYHSPQHSVFDITVSRKELVEFCVQELGLHIGSKVAQQVDIPLWIKEDHDFSVACLRGLVDTDGSIFTHRYKSGGRWYAYKKLDFTSMSKPMLASTAEHTRIDGGKSIRLDRQQDVRNYMDIVGSHNPKHLKRYQKW
jgi:hypothetical protein